MYIIRYLSLTLLLLSFLNSYATGLPYGSGHLGGMPDPRSKIWVVAHRGDWRNAPENSLRAFEYAAVMGVDMVELDLKETKDGVLVIMHDETIDRTSNGKGRASDYTLAELKVFRLKNGLGRVTNNPIPTFKEVMVALKGKVMVNLDKSYPYYTPALAILKETGTLQQALFKSEVPYAELKSKYGSLIDSIYYMPVVDLDKPGARQLIEDYLLHMHLYSTELNFRQDSSTVLSDNGFIRQKGTKVWMNSLWPSLNGGHDDDRAVEEGDTAGSWDWLIAHGATILQTDRPALLLKYLKAKGLHK